MIKVKNFSTVLLVTLLVLVSCKEDQKLSQDPSTAFDRSLVGIVPIPKKVESTNVEVDISKGIYVVPVNFPIPVVKRAAQRMIKFMDKLDIATSNPSAIPLEISVAQNTNETTGIDIDESYQLSIGQDRISIKAQSAVGAMHGLSSLTQILYQSRASNTIPGVRVVDSPRFAWRGLMVDVSRHFISIDKLKQIVQSMSLAKMNVLHLHLSDDQAFRMESKKFPQLHEKASRGKFYKQDEMKSFIEYSSDHGIRVIPEFDMPGHVTSMLAAYPDLGALNKSVSLVNTYGIFPNVLNPVSDKTYKFIEELISEMSNVFNDDYFHIGGDEVIYDQWAESDDVKKFMSEHDLQNFQQVHSYFSLKVQEILKRQGKKMMAWDEVLRKQIADGDVIIQARRDNNFLFDAARNSINGILSKSWNLDHKLGFEELYEVDPHFNPNELQIIPDTSYWKSWDIDVAFEESIAEGKVFIFGKFPSHSGLIQIRNTNAVLEDLQVQDESISFNFDIGAGIIKGELKQDGDNLEGVFETPLFDIPVQGTFSASEDINSQSLPKFTIAKPLDEDERDFILGGEACIWTEWIDEGNILSRIWPANCAISEKLWSQDYLTSDSRDFYRRMKHFEELIRIIVEDYKISQRDFVLEVSGEGSPIHMTSFIEALEEVKFYERFTYNPSHHIDRPLDLIADVVSPESHVTYEFGQMVDHLLFHGLTEENKESIINQLNHWIPVYQNIETSFKNPKIKNIEVLALALSDLSKIALHVMNSGTLTERELQYYSDLKANAQRKIAGVYLAPSEDLIRLIDSYINQI